MLYIVTKTGHEKLHSFDHLAELMIASKLYSFQVSPQYLHEGMVKHLSELL